jgi:7,8-didemethyl-8-hydroxy-5-deazariboflavin synthase CofH subunit
MTSLPSDSIDRASPAVASILARALEGRDVTWEEGVVLSGARGADLEALVATANALRKDQAGEAVSYVVNRNINFTNACIKACRFCAFSRVHRSEEAYFLDEEEVIRRSLEAASLGATEVCLQAGLAPKMAGDLYIRLCRAVKTAAPSLHIHAFSPEEVKYGASLSGMTHSEYLAQLKDAGLGSLPGTSAEILDDEVRALISPGRITTAEWIDVITSAHRLGIPTTSTIMFGHVETAAHRMRHLDLLRSIQRETRGFTELVPLSFVHEEAPLFKKGFLDESYDGPPGEDVIRFHAIARLMMGRDFRHLQTSWVKQGLDMSETLLDAGADDLGGTLMNESISTAAGARHGQLVTPSALRAIIRRRGRIPVQRDTLYRPIRVFDGTVADDAEPLDGITDPEAVFGSFRTMTHDERFRVRRLPVAGESRRTSTPD